MVLLVQASPLQATHFRFYVRERRRDPVNHGREVLLHLVYVLVEAVLGHVAADVVFAAANPFQGALPDLLTLYVPGDVSSPFLVIGVEGVGELLLAKCHEGT